MPRFVLHISVMLAAIASGTYCYLRYCSECRSAAPEPLALALQAPFREEGAYACCAEQGCDRAPENGVFPDAGPARTLSRGLPVASK